MYTWLLYKHTYSEVSNKHGVFLILFENALLEPPNLLISEKSTPNNVFLCNKYEKETPLRPYLYLHFYLIMDIFPTYKLKYYGY